MSGYKSAVSHMLGGTKAPKKEIREISVRKSHNGGHIITHKHHNSYQHPDEEHTTKGDKEMLAHMAANASAAPAADAAAPMTAAPSPMPAGAAPQADAGAAAMPGM